MLVVKKGQLWEEANWNKHNIMGSITTIWYLISDPYEQNYEYSYEKEVDAISLDCNSKIQSLSTRMFIKLTGN